MAIKLYPAIDLLDGKCVCLQGGDPKIKLFESGNPLGFAEKWAAEGADGLHLIDLDGAIRGQRKNKQAIYEIVRLAAKKGIPCEVGGGIRTIRDAQEVVEAGARAIIGSKIEDEEFIREASAAIGRENLIAGLDARGKTVLKAGWAEETQMGIRQAIKKCEKYVGAFLYTNVSIEGSMKGIDPAPIREITKATRLPLIVAGGVKDAGDVRALDQLGAHACILGVALYKNPGLLRQAKAILKQVL